MMLSIYKIKDFVLKNTENFYISKLEGAFWISHL